MHRVHYATRRDAAFPQLNSTASVHCVITPEEVPRIFHSRTSAYLLLRGIDISPVIRI